MFSFLFLIDRYIGGGILTTGCVQEEIMFCMNPELLVSLLWCDFMNSQEAIVISNVKTFNTSTGYAHSFHFHGPFQSPSPSPLHTILAIDALNYRHNFLEQFNEDKVLREFNKVCSSSWKRARSLCAASPPFLQRLPSHQEIGVVEYDFSICESLFRHSEGSSP